MIKSLPKEYDWMFEIMNRYPYDEESVFGVCKACGSIIPINNMSLHKNECPIPESLRLQVVSFLLFIYL